MIPNRPAGSSSSLFTLATTMVLLMAACVQAQVNTPAWKFEADTEFDVVLTQSTKIKSQVDSRVKNVDNQLTLNLNWKVNEVSDEGTATIEMTIASIQMRMQSMPNGVGKSIDIDTSSEAKKKGTEADLLKQLNPLVGAIVVIEISPRGEITKTEVPKDTLAALRNAPVSMKLRTILESDGIKDLFGQSAIVFPSDLTEGKPWSTKNDLETGFGKFVATHTIEWTGNRNSGDNEIAQFKLSSSIDAVDERGPNEPKLVDFSGGGEFVFDVTEGHAVSSKSSNEMKTEQPYREKTIVTTVTTVVEMQINKK